MLSVAPQVAFSQGMFNSSVQMLHACDPLPAACFQGTFSYCTQMLLASVMPPFEGFFENSADIP